MWKLEKRGKNMIPKSMLVNIARENGLYVDAIKKCDNIAELELSEEPLNFSQTQS